MAELASSRPQLRDRTDDAGGRPFADDDDGLEGVRTIRGQVRRDPPRMRRVATCRGFYSTSRPSLMATARQATCENQPVP
jgi:hypothetical protein